MYQAKNFDQKMDCFKTVNYCIFEVSRLLTFNLSYIGNIALKYALCGFAIEFPIEWRPDGNMNHLLT